METNTNTNENQNVNKYSHQCQCCNKYKSFIKTQIETRISRNTKPFQTCPQPGGIWSEATLQRQRITGSASLLSQQLLLLFCSESNLNVVVFVQKNIKMDKSVHLENITVSAHCPLKNHEKCEFIRIGEFLPDFENCMLI